MYIIKMYRLTTLALFSIIILLGIMHPRVSSGELPVDSYCELTIRSMQQNISNCKELIKLVSQYSHDSEELAQQERLKREAFDNAEDGLYASFGTSAQEYILYMGKNRDAVNDYLEKHPEIKQKIDSLTFQINFHLVVYESMREDL